MNTNKPIRLFLVILALSLLEACSPSEPSAKADKPPGIKVKLSSVQEGSIEATSEFIASLQSRCLVNLQPPIEGQVAKIFVKLGDRVAAGTAIVQVKPVKQQGQLQDFKISAPCAGTVGDILVKEGEYVNTSTKLATITNNQPLEVNISVPSELAQKLRLGMPVQLMDVQGHFLDATKVFFISPNVDISRQTVLIKSLFNNSRGQLRNGQLVHAKVTWDKRLGVLIPTKAVSIIGDQSYVFIAQSQGKDQLVARKKAVKLGEIQGNNFQVIQGLQSGEKIVVSGLLNLSDGAAIIPEER